MLRLLSAPLLFVALFGCHGPNAPLASPSPASLTVGLRSPLVTVVEQSDKGTAEEQEAPVEGSAPMEKAQDPEVWEPVDEVSGKAVVTVRRFYSSGHLRRIHTQITGKLGPTGHHGRDLHQHENGVLLQEAFWVDGKLDGPYREWHEGGKLKVESNFQAGKRHGNHREYGGEGKLRLEAQYNAGKLHGAFRQWFGTGNPQEVSHWVEGTKSGSFQLWGRELTPISLENFVNGKLHGKATVFHRIAGEEKIHQTGEYKIGLKEGLWVEFNPEGERVQEKEFTGGKVNGFYKEWRGDVLTLETAYINNVENGNRVECFADGKPFSRGRMKDGAREGVWVYWQEDGRVQGTWSGLYVGGNKVRELTPEEISGEGSSNE